MATCTNVNPSEYPSIRNELLLPAYAGMDSAQKATELSKDILVVNPAPAPKVPIPIDATRLFTLMGKHVEETRRKAIFSKSYADLRAVAEDADAKSVATWGALLVARRELIQSELDEILAALPATHSDPNHPTHLAPTNRLSQVTSRTNGGIADWEIDIVEAS